MQPFTSRTSCFFYLLKLFWPGWLRSFRKTDTTYSMFWILWKGVEKWKKTKKGLNMWTHHDCYSERSPLSDYLGHSTPWPGTDILGHILWCHLGPSCLAVPPCGHPQVGHSQTSYPQVGRCICYRGSTGSRWGDISGCFCTDPASCSSLQENTLDITT